MQQVLDDLKTRGLDLAAVVAGDKEGNTYVICYDTRGLVEFISQACEFGVSLNERRGGRVFRPIVDIVPKNLEEKINEAANLQRQKVCPMAKSKGRKNCFSRYFSRKKEAEQSESEE